MEPHASETDPEANKLLKAKIAILEEQLKAKDEHVKLKEKQIDELSKQLAKYKKIPSKPLPQLPTTIAAPQKQETTSNAPQACAAPRNSSPISSPPSSPTLASASDAAASADLASSSHHHHCPPAAATASTDENRFIDEIDHSTTNLASDKLVLQDDSNIKHNEQSDKNSTTINHNQAKDETNNRVKEMAATNDTAKPPSAARQPLPIRYPARQRSKKAKDEADNVEELFKDLLARYEKLERLVSEALERHQQFLNRRPQKQAPQPPVLQGGGEQLLNLLKDGARLRSAAVKKQKVPLSSSCADCSFCLPPSPPVLSLSLSLSVCVCVLCEVVLIFKGLFSHTQSFNKAEEQKQAIRRSRHSWRRGENKGHFGTVTTSTVS